MLSKPRDALQTAIVAEALNAAQSATIELCWQSSVEERGFARVVAVVPIAADSFDSLFNGPTGYRAQYYLGVEAGRDFNRSLVNGLIPALRANHAAQRFAVDWRWIEQSLSGELSKVWVAGDACPFRSAEPGEFRPRRWAERHAADSNALALRAPLPPRPAIDVKGTWVLPTGDVWVSDEKRDRHQMLTDNGFV
jgi:hypothetical protein